MTDDATVTPFRQPGSILDPLTEIARDGARRMRMAALKAEADGFAALVSEDPLADGRQRIVRHGAGPGRAVQTGIGPIGVRRRKVRDRATDAPAEARIRFASTILPKWPADMACRHGRGARTAPTHCRPFFTRAAYPPAFGHPFGPVAVMPSPQEALSALRGTDAPNLSPGVISRLTAGWQDDRDRWQGRDPPARRHVRIRAGGVCPRARMEPGAGCVPVSTGATPEGREGLPGFHVGIRESARGWRGLLIDVKARGLALAPEAAVGDGALGFWEAVDGLFPGARHQRSNACV